MLSPHYFNYPTPLGNITIASNGTAITHIAFGTQRFPGEKKSSALTNKASTQILQYLAGKRKLFDIPFEADGTEFHKRVWSEVLKIPYGQTYSYGQIAALIGNVKATRAVGMANNKNPLPLLIPCHRVIGASGKPVGYVGGLKRKEFLLDLEKEHAH